MYQRIKKRIWNQINDRYRQRNARERYRYLTQEIIDYFFENREWAAPLALLDTLMAVNKKKAPNHIIEIGTGVSSVAIARSLSNNQSVLYIDENMDFLHATSHKIMTIQNNMAFLNPASLSGEDRINYLFLMEHMPNLRADLLVIDGPTGKRFTQHAKEFYARTAKPSSICLIDDIDRADNSQGADWLAKICSLQRIDVIDTLYPNQKFAALFPADSRASDHGIIS